MNPLASLEGQILSCRKCPRLVEWREQVARVKRKAYRDQDYWGKPVPGFGDPRARILVVGLAPGAHGSNRTGRQFTGDASGGFLYPALHRAGLANRPAAESRGDGLILSGVYLTAAGRCAPPQNKPTSAELENCRPFLERELEIINPRVIVCLGRIAFESILRIYPGGNSVKDFAHGASYPLVNGKWLLCSYHPSRQNTQTGRLTREMFDAVWKEAKTLALKEG
jgi:uracil-DNA glycosylase family 4